MMRHPHTTVIERQVRPSKQAIKEALADVDKLSAPITEHWQSGKSVEEALREIRG